MLSELSPEEKWRKLTLFYAVDWVLFARFLKSIGATLEDFVRFHQLSFAPERCETAGEYLSHMLPKT